MFLDVACGSLPVCAAVLPHLGLSRYWGIDSDRGLVTAGVTVELPQRGLRADHGHILINRTFDLSDSPYRFDLALAHSLVGRVTPAELTSAATSVLGYLNPTG